MRAAQGRLLQEGDSNVIVVGQQVINQFWDERERRQMERGMMHWENDARRKGSGEMLDQRIIMTIRNNNNYEKKKMFNFTVVGVLGKVSILTIPGKHMPLLQI